MFHCHNYLKTYKIKQQKTTTKRECSQMLLLNNEEVLKYGKLARI